MLPRRGPLTNSVPLEFTTLSSVESTKEISGESTAHETASTTAEGLFTQLDAQSTSQQPATSITENAVISSEEGAFIPTDETGEVSTVPEHSSSPFRQSETASETTELPEGIGPGTAFETTTSIEGVTNRVAEAVSSTEGGRKEDKELLKPERGEATEGKSTALPTEPSSTAHTNSDVIGTSITDAAVESEGTILSAVNTESFTTEPRSIDSSRPAEEDLAIEEGHIFVSAKTTTLPDRSASEDEISKEEKTPEVSIYGNEPEPPLAPTDGHVIEATAQLPENEAEEGETTASSGVTQSVSGTTDEVQNARKATSTSTVSFEDEAFTAGMESESTTFKQPVIITTSADFVKSSTTAAGSAEKLETSFTKKLTTWDESLERLQTNTVGSTQEPEGLSSLSPTTSSTYGSDEEKKRSSKLPESVSAVESADEAEPEWPDHAKEDEMTSFRVQSVSEENSEQSEATTTAARIINAGEVIVDLGVAITTIEPQEFSAKQETQETQEVSLSTSSLGESIDETVTKAAKYDEIASCAGSKFSDESLATIASSSEQTVTPTETVAEVTSESGGSTAEQNEASLSTSGDTASTSTVATSFTDATGGGEVHSSTMNFATMGSEYELKSAFREENVEELQSTSLKEGQYTASTVAGDVVASFTESSKSDYFTTTEKTRSESDVVSREHLPAESSIAIFTGDETTTTTSVDTKSEEKVESEGKVRIGEDNEMLTTLEHGKTIEATTVTEQSTYEASSSEPEGVAFVTAKPEGEEEEETSSKTASTITSSESVSPVGERVTSEVTDEKVEVSSVAPDGQLAIVTSAEEVSKKTDALNDVSTSEIAEEGDQTDHITEPISHKLADEATEEAMKVSSIQKATDGSTTPLSIEAAFIPDLLKKIQKTINSDRSDKTSKSTQLIEDLNVDASNAQMTKVDESVTQSTATGLHTKHPINSENTASAGKYTSTTQQKFFVPRKSAAQCWSPK